MPEQIRCSRSVSSGLAIGMSCRSTFQRPLAFQSFHYISILDQIFSRLYLDHWEFAKWRYPGLPLLPTSSGEAGQHIQSCLLGSILHRQAIQSDPLSPFAIAGGLVVEPWDVVVLEAIMLLRSLSRYCVSNNWS